MAGRDRTDNRVHVGGEADLPVGEVHLPELPLRTVIEPVQELAGLGSEFRGGADREVDDDRGHVVRVSPADDLDIHAVELQADNEPVVLVVEVELHVAKNLAHDVHGVRSKWLRGVGVGDGFVIHGVRIEKQNGQRLSYLKNIFIKMSAEPGITLTPGVYRF